MANTKRSVIRALAAISARIIPDAVLWNPAAFDIWERRGAHVTQVHFYSPIPDTRRLKAHQEFEEFEVNLNDDCQRRLAEAALEYNVAGLEGRYGYTFQNDSFTGADAVGLYGIVRAFKPKTVIEIGSGMSTRVTLAALEDNGDGNLVTVEPYEADRMPQPPTYTLPVQELPRQVFEDLQANDILFIDSSHVVATQSDVVHLILRVLPRLAPGVLVYFHDIFLPNDYPLSWLLDRHRFWTEQYLLHAFLIGNDAWEIIWGSWALSTRHGFLGRWPHGLAGPEPGASLWIRKLA